LYVKGAIEQILKLSKRYLHNQTAVQITEEKIRQFLMDSNQMAAKGLRSMKIILTENDSIDFVF
jgi:magnesium-transporting ATPase (P-type)